MSSIKINQILQALGPNYPTPLIGWTLYVIIVLVLATMFLQKKGNNTITLLLSAVIMACLIDKINAFPLASFGAFVVRIIIFVFPMVVAGMTKWPKSRGPAIFASVLAAVYLFGRWFFEQRGV